jgi:hypothetical protein
MLDSAAEFGVQMSQVALQHWPVHLGQLTNVHRRVSEELPESADGQNAQGRCLRHSADGQSPASPPFRQLLQPGLWDVREVDVRDAAVADA